MRRHWWSSLPYSAAALIALSPVLPARAPAQIPIPIPGMPQIVLDPKNLIENARQAAQIAQQIEYQRQALRKLRNPTWRDIDAHIRQVEYLLQQGEALGYSASDLDRRFQQTFPGEHSAAIPNPSQAQRDQARRTLETIRAVLNVLNAHSEQFRVDRARLGYIKMQMGSIDGTQEALELQATLGAYTAEEIGLLRQTIAAQANLQAINNAYLVSRDAEMRARFEAMTARMSTPPDGQPNYSLKIRR